MRLLKDLPAPRRQQPPQPPPGARVLGLATDDPALIVRAVRMGFPFRRLAKLQKAMGLAWDVMASFVGIPLRTLTRRQREGTLRPDESDRVWRIAMIFDLACDLFEGDVQAASRWLQAPQRGLGGVPPLEFASTQAGAREVENLIMRLEHGVFI
jgi:putative toxin-antitoxin system antitoxin component (TIGR02293 family)